MKNWETFLRVQNLTLTDEPPALDEAWMIPRGVDPLSPAVLKHLRDDVAPLVTELLEVGALDGYHFLVHAFPLVPTTAEDTAPYIHLRLEFAEDENAEELLSELPAGWRFSRCWEKGEIAGVDGNTLDVGSRWDLLQRQSEWLLDLVLSHKDVDLGTLVKHTRQYLHFFANMTQMKVA